MRIPINMGVKGRVTATLTNTETGEKQEVKGNNLILNHYLDWAMERGLGVLGTTTFDRCYIGTSDVPPQPTDTTFVGTQLAVSSTSSLVGGVNTETRLKIEKSIVGLSFMPEGGLALTPDWKILIATKETGIIAYLVEDLLNSSDPQPLYVPDFNVIDYACKDICCGGDYLFVGMEQPPRGKIYKRVGDSFTFFADFPSETPAFDKTRISSSGQYVACRESGSLRIFEIFSQGTVVEIKNMYVGSFVDLTFVSDSDDICTLVELTDSTEIQYRKKESGWTISSKSYPSMQVRPQSIISFGNNLILAFGYSQSGATRYVRVFSSIIEDGNLTSDVVTTLGSVSSTEETRQKTVSLNDYIILSNGYIIALNSSTNYPVDIMNNYSVQASIVADKHRGLVYLVSVDEEGNNVFLVYKIRDFQAKHAYSRQWTFPAGTGTGTINRIGLQANSGTGENGNNRHVAQIVLPEPLEKTDLHQLDVIWEIEVENPGVWEGVIPGGSRDGSDLDWRVTINEEQFYDLVQTGYRIPANWFGTTGTPNVRIGTSNEESDLIFDRGNLRGEQIQYISSTAIREVNPYVPGSLKRTIRLFLEVDQGNGQIGEVVFGGSTSDKSLARITFDPPLDKPPHVGEGANPYRLYLDLEIGWQRGESGA